MSAEADADRGDVVLRVRAAGEAVQRAGHNPPVLYNPRRDGRCLRLQPGGLGLGILGDPLFERTIQVLGSTYGYTPALVLSHLAGALDGFTGRADSEDDITAVCVRFR